MKYKVADKVRIKSKEELKDTIGTVSDMIEYEGKNAVIIKVSDHCYDIDLDQGAWSWTDDMFEDEPTEPTLFDRIKSAIIEAGKQAPIIIEQTEDGGVKISPIENKEEDLPIDTPVMVSNNLDYKRSWKLRYYAGKMKCFDWGETSKNHNNSNTPWHFIIPFDKFNPADIEESLKYNIVK